MNECSHEQASARSAEIWMNLLNQACSEASLVLGRQCQELGLVSLRMVQCHTACHWLLFAGNPFQGKKLLAVRFLSWLLLDLLSLFPRSPPSALGACKGIGGGMKRKRCLEHKQKATINIWAIFSDLIHCNNQTFTKIQAEVVPCQTKCNRNLRSSCQYFLFWLAFNCACERKGMACIYTFVNKIPHIFRLRTCTQTFYGQEGVFPSVCELPREPHISKFRNLQLVLCKLQFKRRSLGD